VEDSHTTAAQVIWKPNKKNAPPSKNNPMRPIKINPSSQSLEFENCKYAAINKKGWVVSSEKGGNQNYLGTLYTGNAIIELDDVVVGTRGINNSNVIVGHTDLYPYKLLGVLTNSKRLIFLNHVFPQYKTANAGAVWDINDKGDATAAFNICDINTGSQVPHAIVWTHKNKEINLVPILIHDINANPSDEMQPMSINKHGWIVGSVEASKPFLTNGKVAYNLNNCVANPGTNGLSAATGINDRGCIVAIGRDGNGQTGFLLSPQKKRPKKH
jgi:hypothetical protein